MRSKDGVVLKNAKVGVMRTREVLEVRCGVSQRVVGSIGLSRIKRR